MSNLLKILFWLHIWLKQESETGIAAKKFLYHRDMSEHCRRRVMPSVFLGRHVVNAYSQVLHFSRIDLPYSCYISVRTESGSNIILVLQLVTDIGHVKPCQESPNQLVVYEMGETFGGYWGPLPKVYMRPRQHRTTAMMYTLKTSPSTQLDKVIHTTTTGNTPVIEETTTPRSSDSDDITEQQDLIELNIPLVNVSAIVAPVAHQAKVFNFDKHFDFLYDLMPREKWENVSYQTSILPLAEVSLKKQKNDRLSDARNMEPRYKFDYNFLFTPDIRLTRSRIRGVTSKKIQFPKYTFYRNRPRKPLLRKHPLLAIHDNRPYIKRSKSPLHRLSTTGSIKNKFIISKTSSDARKGTEVIPIDKLMRGFNKSENYTEVSDNKQTALLAELSNMGCNVSAQDSHPNPDFQFNNSPRGNSKIPGLTTLHAFIDNNNSFIKSSLTFTLQSEQKVHTIFKTSKMEQLQTEINEVNLNNTQDTDLQKNMNESDFINIITNDKKMVTEKTNFRTANVLERNSKTKSATLPNISSTHLRGSLVDHESWENVVRVAPVIANLLNQSVKVANTSHSDRIYISNVTKEPRKKRHIHVLPINNAKPHKMTTKRTVPTVVSTTFHISDIQDFFRLVELHDDELHDRVALRYLRQYMGPSVFNICEFTEPKSRRVQLFNSSRIVIALSNFTIEKLTLVMTPARTLLSGEIRCGTSNIECQVSGTRVCIDSMSACDGVPNCGAYDIFDEDRIMCGVAVGLQHNVWLAAVTFLAVMLTVLYTVHYWLTRCVPKVSKAFFIYSDGDENTLNLDSIMRSPNDMYDGPIYRNLQQDKVLHSNKNIKTITCCSWVVKFFNKLRRHKKEEDLPDNSAYQFHQARRMYSFTQTEISKIVNKDFTDVSVQTGESLEMSYIGKKNLKICDLKTKQGTDLNDKKSSVHDRPMVNRITSSLESNISLELSLLKLFKDSKDLFNSESKEAFLNLTLDSNIDRRLRESEEKEIQSHVYDRTRGQTVFPTTSSVHSVTTVPEMHSDIIASQSKLKRLRFTEEPIAIQTTINEDKFEENSSGHRIVKTGLNKHRTNQDINSDKEDDGQVPSASRDFKRFFSGSKGKKYKKKKSHANMPLR